MTSQFHKQITNARNSQDELEVSIQNDIQVSARGSRRTSAAQLQREIIPAHGTRKNFTTITPKGLPKDLIGDVDNPVERQNVLAEPKGQKNERARLPPFKPFKTISDEDNIHLLPGETGERARLNLLDTKAVTTTDVDEVRDAYYRLREQNPELYRKQQAPVHHSQKPSHPSGQPTKKTGLFNKLFGKKPKEPEKKPEAPKPEEKPKPEEPKPEDKPKPDEPHHHHHPKHKPKSNEVSLIAEAEVDKSRRPSTTVKRSKPPRRVTPPSEESSEESEDDEDYHRQMMEYYRRYQGQGAPYPYPAGGGMPYPGTPGGYGMPYNQSYAGGFGPMQASPMCNPCADEIQYTCKRPADRDKCTPRKVLKKPQGLNFDFLPHDDLATEVTMIIEPDEPEPLQYAVENGIMPIICCYMPSSLAVSQQQQSNTVPFSGYPTHSSGNTGSYYSTQYYSKQGSPTNYSPYSGGSSGKPNPNKLQQSPRENPQGYGDGLPAGN